MDIALRELGEGKVAVAHQLMTGRARQAADIQRSRGVLQQCVVADLQNVAQVGRVCRGARVRLIEGLVASPAGKFDESLAIGGCLFPLPLDALRRVELRCRDELDVQFANACNV